MSMYLELVRPESFPEMENLSGRLIFRLHRLYLLSVAFSPPCKYLEYFVEGSLLYDFYLTVLLD